MAQDGLEAALASTDERLAAAGRSAAGLARELKRAAAASATGQVRDLRRSLEEAVTTAGEVLRAAESARDGFDFDDITHLASGGFAQELMTLAAQQGVSLYEEDERLLCYPSLLRVLPNDAAVEIDKRRERRLRPSVLLSALARSQNRPPRFRAEPFLASLLSAYELLAARDDRDDRDDPIVRLDAVWEVLTLLPGQARDYTRPEFARDLYLLDQSGARTTRSGRELRWHASTGTRGAGVLTTVARGGQQQRYWGASFTPIPPAAR